MTIDGNVYKVFLLDAESGSYNLIFNNWNNGKQVPDFAITANRDYYLRVTATGVTEMITNGIETATAARDADTRVYDLQGRMVGTSADRLPRGLYVVNGKKYIIH